MIKEKLRKLPLIRRVSDEELFRIASQSNKVGLEIANLFHEVKKAMKRAEEEAESETAQESKSDTTQETEDSETWRAP